MTPQELRNSILRFAIQGRLFRQTNFDEVEKPLETKKEEGLNTLSKRKVMSINTDELPFEIPVNWRWVRLGDIADIEAGGTPARDNPRYWGGKIPWLKIGDLKGKYVSSSTEFITEEGLHNSSAKLFKKGTLLYSIFASIGTAAILDFDSSTNQAIVGISLLENVDKEYLYYVLVVLKELMVAKGRGMAQLNINQKILKETPIPIPPLQEQKRIVEKIESLMPLVDEYERVWNRLDVLNKSISSELIRSLLKAAAEGKLPYSSVGNSQDNNYLQLVRDDSLAFEKTLGKKASQILPIEESEIPFEIPDNWSWMRLSQLVSKRIKRGKSPKYIKSSGVLVFAQKCNTKKGYIDLSLSQFLDESQLSKYDESEYMKDGDIVINSTGGGTLGRVGIYHTTDNQLKMPIVPDSHVTVVRVNPRVNNKFVYYVLKYYQPYLETLGDGSTNQTELHPMTIAELLIPLPSRAEQDSIVATLESVLPLCRDLEANPSA